MKPGSSNGIAFADAHPGPPVILLRSLNGSVTNETAKSFEAALDPYNPANGYSATASSIYSPEFQSRYFAAQSRRMNALIDAAIAKRAAARNSTGPLP